MNITQYLIQSVKAEQDKAASEKEASDKKWRETHPKRIPEKIQ